MRLQKGTTVLENTISDWNLFPSKKLIACGVSIREHYKWLKHETIRGVNQMMTRIREHYKWLKPLAIILATNETIGIREHYKWLKHTT